MRAARNAAYRIAATLTGVEAIRGELGEVSTRVADLERSLGDLGGSLERVLAGAEHNRQELHGTLERNRHEAIEIMQRSAMTSRRLAGGWWALRQTESYLQAYAEPEPLVTVVIPTYTNTNLLVERSLPAVLGQTYERLEVLVVGDGAGPEVEQAVKRIGDARIRYVNLTHRGPYLMTSSSAGVLPAVRRRTRGCGWLAGGGSRSCMTMTRARPITSSCC